MRTSPFLLCENGEKMKRENNDLVTKAFLSFPDIAADVINVLLFEGEERVQSRHLLSSPTESLYVSKDGLRNQLEDAAQYEICEGEVRGVYLFANQTRIDRRMLLRKAGYVGGAYREQYLHRQTRIYPVVEMVLYWGRQRWRQAPGLHEMLGQSEHARACRRYVDDMKLNMWEMRHLPESVRCLFKSDMRIVVDYLAEGAAYRSDRKIVHKAALIKMIRVLGGESNVSDTEHMLEEMCIREEDEVTMCELFDQYTRKGVEKGFKKGIESGIAKGRAGQLVTGIENLMKNVSCSLEQACSMLGVTQVQYREAKKQLLQ